MLSRVSASVTTHTIDFLGTLETLCVFIPGYEIARSDTPRGSREHSVAAYIMKPYKHFVTECGFGNVLVVYLCTYDVYLIFDRRPSYDSAQTNSLISFICESKQRGSCAGRF